MDQRQNYGVDICNVAKYFYAKMLFFSINPKKT